MLLRLSLITALAAGPVTTPAFAAEPGPSAAVSAHCPEMAQVPLDKLPASAWAAAAYPADQEQALRAKGGDLHAVSAPSVRVLRRDDDGHVSSVVAEKGSVGWTLWVTEDKGGGAKSHKARLNADRTRALDHILADACFWAEPSELGGGGASTCVDATDFHLEAITDRGRRSAVQHCSPLGLTGQAAETLWNGADVE